MRCFALAVLIISASMPALAADPKPVVPPHGPLAVIPVATIEAMKSFIRDPQVKGATDLWLMISACEQANAPDASAAVKAACPDVAQFFEEARATADAKTQPAQPFPAPTDTPATK